MQNEFSRFYQCVAVANPIPLIQWVLNDGNLLNSPNITINGSTLVPGSNIYTCVARSRNGMDNLTVSIILVSEQIDVNTLLSTQDQVSEQESLNEEETEDLSSLILTSVQGVNNSMNTENGTDNSSVIIVTAVSGLYSDVIRLADNSISENTTESLFGSGGELVRTTQANQGEAQDALISINNAVSYFGS